MEDPQLPLDIEVRAVKTPDGYVGVGAMVCCGDTVVWEESKYVGQGLSWHVAEYGGLLDAMHAAEALGLLFLNARVSSRVVSDQVNGFWKPKLANQWRLLNQVRSAMHNFSSFQIASWPKGTSNAVVSQLAQAAISSHLAGDSSSSCAGASTSGATNNVAQQNEASDAVADSSNIRRIKKENCFICFEDKFSSEMATVKKCQHKFCVACMQRHAEVQVQASQVPVRCPQAGCPEMLENEECRQFLTPEIFSILMKRLMEAKVPEGDRVYCPYANCSTLMRKSGFALPEQGTSAAASKSSVYQKVDCVECKQSFCLDCRVPWHKNWSCQQYQALPPHLRDAEESNLYTLAQSQKWQRCKKCRRLIELAEGCYHMTCRCGYEFCYTCGTEWKNKRQQCHCKLWDERNIIRTPLDSDDESDEDGMYDFLDDDDDEDSDEHIMGEDFFGYDVEEFDDLDYDDFFGDDDSLPGLEEMVHGFDDLTGVLGMLYEPPGRPPFRNRFYKTKLCRYYLRPGGCKEGRLCNFAHGEHELRLI